MKQFITLVGALLLSSHCFADTTNLKGLGSVWKSQRSFSTPQPIQNDITMVYGGQDITPNAMEAPSATA